MGYANERKYIENYFYTSWATATPIRWENVEFEPSVGINFVSFSVLPSKAIRRNIGPNAHGLYRNYGMIEVQIYTQAGTGSVQAATYADNVLSIFRNAIFNGIHCDAGQIQNQEDIGEWLCTIVTIPFYRDEIT